MESSLIAFRGFVVAGGQTAPGLDLLETAFDGVALPVALGIEADGRPPADPFFLRLAC